MTDIHFYVLLALVLAALVLLVLVLLRPRGSAGLDGATLASLSNLAERIERVEREVRVQLQTTAQSSHAATVQQFDGMRRQLETQGLVARDEQTRNLKLFADSMNQTLARLTESNAARMGVPASSSAERSSNIPPPRRKRASRPGVVLVKAVWPTGANQPWLSRRPSARLAFR